MGEYMGSFATQGSTPQQSQPSQLSGVPAQAQLSQACLAPQLLLQLEPQQLLHLALQPQPPQLHMNAMRLAAQVMAISLPTQGTATSTTNVCTTRMVVATLRPTPAMIGGLT